jgi:hypothetical protein
MMRPCRDRPSFQEIEIAFRSHKRRRGCSLPEDEVEPLPGKSTVNTGNFHESDGHDVVGQGCQRGVEVKRIGWTKMGSSSPPRLLAVGPEAKPVHAGNYILFQCQMPGRRQVLNPRDDALHSGPTDRRCDVRICYTSVHNETR